MCFFLFICYIKAYKATANAKYIFMLVIHVYIIMKILFMENRHIYLDPINKNIGGCLGKY